MFEIIYERFGLGMKVEWGNVIVPTSFPGHHTLKLKHYLAKRRFTAKFGFS